MSETTGDPLLAAAIGAFVRSWGAEGSFEDLALRLFRYQYANNAPYHRFCRSRGADPDHISDWTGVPAAPTDAFRLHDLSCTARPPAALFLTSGTTTPDAGARGRHFMDEAALSLYDLSLTTAFRRLAGRCRGLPIRALLPSAAEAPHSSLSHMVSTLASVLAATLPTAAAQDAPSQGARPQGGQSPPALFFWKNEGPDIPAAAASLAAATDPVLVFTTAFALLELLEGLDWPLRLPEGSIVVETGGFKGRRRRLERTGLYELAMDRLGIPPANIGSEYGMCEMASQYYDSYLGRLEAHAAGMPAVQDDLLPSVKVGPPWVRTRFIDPASGLPAPDGAGGLLRHFDLCNLNSVAAIQTADTGCPWPGGGFLLEGRLEGSAPRGCSLTVEEWRARIDGQEDR